MNRGIVQATINAEIAEIAEKRSSTTKSSKALRAQRSLRSTSWFLLAAVFAGACSSGDAKGKDQPAPPAAVAVAPAAAVEQPIARFIRATGTLMAEEQADVAAETGGRVVSAPVERGTPVAPGAELVRISSTETDAQLKEAEANAAQIEARLGITPGTAVRRERGPRSPEREIGLRARAERVRAHQVAARSARRLAVGVRPAADADGSGAAAVRVGQERRRAAVPVAAGGARPRVAGPQGQRRHGRPRALRRHRRGAPGRGRRLRHQGHESRDRRPRQPAARAVDDPGAIRVGDRRRTAGDLRGRRVRRPAVRRPRQVRVSRRSRRPSAR